MEATAVRNPRRIRRLPDEDRPRGGVIGRRVGRRGDRDERGADPRRCEDARAILDLRPGLTDYASIWNIDEGARLAGSADPEREYLEHIRPRKVALQMKYLHEQSLWTDVKLIVLTVLLCTASTVLWTVLSPDFLAARSIADTVKLAAGVGYLIVVFVLVRRVGMEGALRSFRLWGWTATALSLGSLAGITGAVEIIPSDGYRSLGYFQDANLYAGYLLVSLSVLIFLGTVTAKSSPWLPVQAVVILGGIITTGSRGGMLSLALLVGFATLIINSARLRLMVLAGVGAVTAGGWWLLAHRDQGVTVLGVDRLFFASKTQAVEDDPRVALWVRAIEKWLDAPVWGIGAGQFERFSGDVFRVAKSSGLGYVTHNSFLFFLVSFGVIGFGLFLYLLWWIFRDLYRAPHLDRFAKHALASGIVVILSQMMTLNLQNLRYVWIYFGLVLGVAMLERGERDGEQAA